MHIYTVYKLAWIIDLHFVPQGMKMRHICSISMKN